MNGSSDILHESRGVLSPRPNPLSASSPGFDHVPPLPPRKQSVSSPNTQRQNSTQPHETQQISVSQRTSSVQSRTPARFVRDNGVSNSQSQHSSDVPPPIPRRSDTQRGSDSHSTRRNTDNHTTNL